MDGEIWKEIPKELLEVVIAKLPICTLIRFRLVCQKWNSLLISPRFQQLSASFAQPLFFSVALFGNGPAKIGALYDPFMKEWRYTESIPPSYHWYFYSAASSGGLVCYYDNVTHSRFRVGNCLTQTWKEFQWPRWTGPAFGEQDVIIGMATGSHPSAGYKIIWVNGCGYYQVYDSIKETLTSGRIPANIKLPVRLGTRTVSIDTVVYFLARKPDGIISYDVASGAWEQLLIPDPPCSYGSLAECCGRILLAGVGEVKNGNSDSFSVCVWELEREMLCWKEVDRMPSSWDTKFISPNRTLFSCFGNRRVLFMSLSTNKNTWIFTYDVVTREWSKPPRFTIPRRHPTIVDGVGFFPSLSASP